LELRQWLLR